MKNTARTAYCKWHLKSLHSKLLRSFQRAVLVKRVPLMFAGLRAWFFRRGWLRLVLPIVGRLAWFFRGGMVFSRRARGERLWDWLLGA